MNKLRILILPMVIAVFGMYCVNGMEPESDGESRDGRGADLGKRVSRGKIGKERRERVRVDSSEEAQDKMICLRSNDGVDIQVPKEAAMRLSVTFGMMQEIVGGDDVVIPVAISGDVLRKMVMPMTEEHNLLQAGMSPGDVIEAQRADALFVTKLRTRDVPKLHLPRAANYLGCDLISRVLGDSRQESLSDYFSSGILPCVFLALPILVPLVKILLLSQDTQSILNNKK